MTFNVRRRMPVTWRTADRWRVRRDGVRALLAAERPTLLGAQEVLPDQAAFIGAALGGAYRFVGHGRRPGPRGEACPLFYDGDRLELRGWRQRALSDRPDEPGSASWGNVIPRVVVEAVFRDRSTGAEVAAFNTHLDVLSSRSRSRSAQLIRGLVARQDLPAIVTGDLNAGPGSPPLRELLGGDALVDAWTAAERRLSPEWGTFAGYRAARSGQRIDWIGVTPGVRVSRIGIEDRRFDDVWPSDHLPVQAVVRLPERTT